MSINLFGGFAKGFTLQTPNSMSFRPTLTTLRRKFFDKYQNLSGYSFYDLCAGSGAVALEAISYGANSAFMNEKNPKHFGLLKQNVQNFKKQYQGDFEVSYQKGDGLKWISDNQQLFSQPKNIIFFDPPYELLDLYEGFIEILKKQSQLEAVVLIEADKQKAFGVEKLEADFDVKKVFKQGSSYIALI